MFENKSEEKRIRIWDPSLLVSEEKRKIWLEQVVEEQREMGKLSPEQIQVIAEESKRPEVLKHLRDVIWGDIATHYPSLVTHAASLLGLAWGMIDNKPEIALISGGSLAYHIGSPVKVGIGGTFRTAWLAFRVVEDRVNKDKKVMPLPAELLNLGVSFFSVLMTGNISAPLRMYRESPEISELLVRHYSAKVGRVPVVGEKVERFINHSFEKLRDAKSPEWISSDDEAMLSYGHMMV